MSKASFIVTIQTRFESGEKTDAATEAQSVTELGTEFKTVCFLLWSFVPPWLREGGFPLHRELARVTGRPFLPCFTAMSSARMLTAIFLRR